MKSFSYDDDEEFSLSGDPIVPLLEESITTTKKTTPEEALGGVDFYDESTALYLSRASLLNCQPFWDEWFIKKSPEPVSPGLRYKYYSFWPSEEKFLHFGITGWLWWPESGVAELDLTKANEKPEPDSEWVFRKKVKHRVRKGAYKEAAKSASARRGTCPRGNWKKPNR